MSSLRTKKIREMTLREREKKLEELRADLSKTRALLASSGPSENIGKIKQMRRAIARYLTIISEEERKTLGSK